MELSANYWPNLDDNSCFLCELMCIILSWSLVIYTPIFCVYCILVESLTIERQTALAVIYLLTDCTNVLSPSTNAGTWCIGFNLEKSSLYWRQNIHFWHKFFTIELLLLYYIILNKLIHYFILAFIDITIISLFKYSSIEMRKVKWLLLNFYLNYMYHVYSEKTSANIVSRKLQFFVEEYTCYP